MKLKSFILFSMLVCAVATVRAQTIEEAVAKFTEAKSFLPAKEFAKAIPVLEQALTMAEAITDNEGALALADDIKKMIPQVYLYDGVTRLQAKNYEKGLEQLLKAEEVATQYGNPDVRRQASRYASTAYAAMGADSFNNKDYAKALEVFKKGYEQDPKNIQLALYTAKSYAETKDIANAMKLYGEIIAAGAENSKYETMAAEAKTDLGTYVLVTASEAIEANDFDKAYGIITELSKIDDKNDKAQLLLMQAAFKNKKYDIIIENGEKAAQVQLTPEDKSAVYLILGGAYQAKGNNPKALENLKKVTAGPGLAQAQQIIKDLSAAPAQ